jgi:hypothetical protein
MGALKGTTDKIIGTAKEAVAEVIGDARRRSSAKAPTGRMSRAIPNRSRI